MTAQTNGELVLTDGCFRLQRAEPDSGYLLIWPRGFGARLENGRYQVLDDEGYVVAQVGDFLHLSGGEIPSDMASGFAEALPAQCPGPHWVVGLQVEVLSEGDAGTPSVIP